MFILEMFSSQTKRHVNTHTEDPTQHISPLFVHVYEGYTGKPFSSGGRETRLKLFLF